MVAVLKKNLLVPPENSDKGFVEESANVAVEFRQNNVVAVRAYVTYLRLRGNLSLQPCQPEGVGGLLVGDKQTLVQ
jgi:hypothetical protein